MLTDECNTRTKLGPKAKKGKQCATMSGSTKRSQTSKSRTKKPKDIAVAKPKGKRARKGTGKKEQILID